MTIAHTQSDLEQALQDQESSILFEAPNASNILEKYLNKERRRKSRKVYIGVAFLILLLTPFSEGAAQFGSNPYHINIIIPDIVVALIIAIVSTIALTIFRPFRNYKIYTHTPEKIEFTKIS